jgi:hypothetical protein
MVIIWYPYHVHLGIIYNTENEVTFNADFHMPWNYHKMSVTFFWLNRIVPSLATNLWHILNTAELKELNIHIWKRMKNKHVTIREEYYKSNVIPLRLWSPFHLNYFRIIIHMLFWVHTNKILMSRLMPLLVRRLLGGMEE